MFSVPRFSNVSSIGAAMGIRDAFVMMWDALGANLTCANEDRT